MNFNSDNVHGVDDAILDALRDANAGTARNNPANGTRAAGPNTGRACSNNPAQAS